MADRENVITHLLIIHIWAEFARERDLQFFTAKHLEDIAQWADDAIALLKEQDAVVRCKDCKHRPKEPNYKTYESGFDIEFPEVVSVRADVLAMGFIRGIQKMIGSALTESGRKAVKWE